MSSNDLFPAQLLETLEAEAVLAVLTVDKAENAVPLAKALFEGGVRAMELAWRTDATLDALRLIRKEVPDMLAGIGTILTADQLKQVRDEGAAFAVSPGLSPKLLDAAGEIGLPYAPAVATPSEVQVAAEYGCKLLKFFPAEPMGGLKYLNSMNAPFAHLGLKYIALGGLNQDNAGTYLDSPAIAVLGGSWIAQPDLIQSGNWSEIKSRAEKIRALIDSKRGN